MLLHDIPARVDSSAYIQVVSTNPSEHVQDSRLTFDANRLIVDGVKSDYIACAGI